MAAPTTMTEVSALAPEYVNVINTYTNMISAATAFVAAGTALAADPQFSIASSAFKTWGSTVLTQVQSFLSSTSAPPAP